MYKINHQTSLHQSISSTDSEEETKQPVQKSALVKSVISVSDDEDGIAMNGEVEL